MARPIKETPVLTGKKAYAFIKRAEKVSVSPCNERERERVLSVYEKVKAKHCSESVNG